MRVPRWLKITAAILLTLAGGFYWLTLPPERLTVVSWGDTYGRAQTIAFFHPYADKTGIDVRIANYGGGLREIERQVETRDVEWDVVDLELEDAAEACRRGLLEPLDGIQLPPGNNGQAAIRDFVPGAIGPCWVGSVVYSQIIAYDKARFAQNQPTSPADFFDLQRFPGRRALRDNGPKYNLELALIADGVQPWRVYATLATRGGLDRAFAKLDTIKPELVWWRRAVEPMELLTRGQVAMTTILNARAFTIDVEPRHGTIWNSQLYQLDVFGIPKGSPRKTRAYDFIRFATGAAPLAEKARLLPYGPARKSAIALVGRNPETQVEMRPHLPTAPENFDNALAVDPEWWAQHGAEIQARWQEWRNS